MHRDYVGLASIFLRLAMVPDAMFDSSDVRSQDEAGRNAIKNITGRILRSGDLLFLAEEGSLRTYMLADATRVRFQEGKKVRISGTLESPDVIVVRTIDELD
jgi:hypothetical protein